MTPTGTQSALEADFDKAIVLHRFTDHMSNYNIITKSVNAQSTGIEPEFGRYLFKNCVGLANRLNRPTALVDGATCG